MTSAVNTLNTTTAAPPTGGTPHGARKPQGYWRPRSVGQWLTLAACTALLIYFAFPVYVIVSTALKGPGSAGGTLGLPSSIDLSGFRLAWGHLHGNLWNSIQIAVPGTIISCLLGALNGFVLAKTPFRGAKLLFVLMMVGMFIPFQAVIIPLFIFLRALGLQGTLTGIVLVHVIYGLPFVTADHAQLLRQHPGRHHRGRHRRRLRPAAHLHPDRAATVDPGLRGLRHLPVHQHLERLPVRAHRHLPADLARDSPLNNLLGDTSVDYGTLMAGALMVAAPTVLVYIGLGRYFIGGLTSGAVK